MVPQGSIYSTPGVSRCWDPPPLGTGQRMVNDNMHLAGRREGAPWIRAGKPDRRAHGITQGSRGARHSGGGGEDPS